MTTTSNAVMVAGERIRTGTHEPLISVLIPLEYHRGYRDECLGRWLDTLSFPRDQYEVIGIACPSSLSPADRAELESRLIAPNRLVLFDEPHDIALCAHAATLAKGEILVFSESHCLPEPDVLSKTLSLMREHPEWAGLSGSSQRIIHNRLSSVEADIYETDVRRGPETHPWRQILDQIFVVRREVYLSVGGLRPGLGHFAEWHLAARMYQLGHHIAHAPEVRVEHYYSGVVDELVAFTADFARGEAMYQFEESDDPCQALFVNMQEHQQRHTWLGRFSRTSYRLSWMAHSGRLADRLDPREWICRLRLTLMWWRRMRLGVTPACLGAAARLRVARLILQLAMIACPWRAPIHAAMSNLMDAAIRHQRILYLRGWLDRHNRNNAALVSRPSPLNWRPDTHERDYAGVGFHAMEEWNSTQFRWSEPVAVLELSLAPGRYAFRLDWPLIRPIHQLRVFLDERQLDIVCETGCVTGMLDVITWHPVQFSLTCEPWLSAKHDSRLLGVPVSAISWSRI